MNDSSRGAIQQFRRAMPGLRAVRELPESGSSICRWTLGFVNDRGNPPTDVSIGMDWREFDAFNFDFLMKKRSKWKPEDWKLPGRSYSGGKAGIRRFRDFQICILSTAASRLLTSVAWRTLMNRRVERSTRAGWLLVCWLALWAAPPTVVLADHPAGSRFDPVERELDGWKVHVEPALIDGEHAEEGKQALTMLANHLQRIKILVPAGPLAKLQQIEMWIEHSHPQLKAMQYHPSRRWLVDHGHDPRLARKVHITQARELLSREQMLKHPAVILHELAHGYHDQVLSFDDPEVIAAFERAKEAGIYDQVLLYTGKTVRHYGLSNHKEYFAEGTEAYFYRNDFYPFVRAELKRHDPLLCDLLEKVWGDK